LLVGCVAVVGAAGLGVLLSPAREVLSNRAPCQLRAAVRDPASLVEEPRSAAPGWHLASANPVLTPALGPGWETYSVYDAWVERLPDRSLAMWYSSGGHDRAEHFPGARPDWYW
jgi:hypothetical protein